MAAVFNPISFNELVARSEPLFLKEMPARIKCDMFSFIKIHIDDGGDWDAAFLLHLLEYYGITNKQAPQLMQYVNANNKVSGVHTDPAPSDPYYLSHEAAERNSIDVGAVSRATSGLNSFLLVPPHLRGAANGKMLLDHLIRKRKRSINDEPGINGSAYLDLQIGVDQNIILNPSPEDFAIGTLLKDASSGAVGRKLASRKINILGEQVGACCVANDPERLRNLKQGLNLASAIEEAKLAKRNAQTAKLDDPNAKSAKKVRSQACKRREMPVWLALVDAGAMLTPARAAQFKPPQIKELQNYINFKNLECPRGKTTRENLLEIVSQSVGAVVSSDNTVEDRDTIADSDADDGIESDDSGDEVVE